MMDKASRIEMNEMKWRGVGMKQSIRMGLAALWIGILTGSSWTIAGAADLSPLMTDYEVGAKSAVVIEAATGRVVFEQNSQVRLPMASTTKIMTTLLVLEEENLDLPFVVDAEAIRVEGSSMGLKAGDTVTLRTLCYGMMLSSGNDAANAAAQKVAGSLPAFIERMNQKADDLGLAETSFATPSGLDGENHYSTAHDMALVLRAALQNPDFEAISSTKTGKVSFGNPPYDRWLTNHNRLLWSCDGVVGGKTGFTKESGRCLVSVARRDGVTLICATLGCPDDWSVHADLYDRAFAELTAVDLTSAYTDLTLPVAGGTGEATLIGGGLSTLALTPQEAEELTVTVHAPPFLYAPVEAGEFVGEIAYSMGNVVLWKESLHVADDVPLAQPPKPEKISLWQRFFNRLKQEK